MSTPLVTLLVCVGYQLKEAAQQHGYHLVLRRTQLMEQIHRAYLRNLLVYHMSKCSISLQENTSVRI